MKLMWKGTIALCFMMMFCISAFAAETPEITYNYSENRLEISGETSDSSVTLQILKYGKDSSGLNNISAYKDTVLYTKQIDISGSSVYSFSVRYADLDDADFVSGEYNAYLKTENQLTDFKLDLFSKLNYEETVGLLNGYADNDNNDEFKRVLEENGKLLGYNSELYNKVSASEALKKCMAYVKSNHLNGAESVKNKTILNRFLIMQGLKEGTVSEADAYVSGCFTENDNIYKDYLKYVSTADARRNFTDKMKTELPSDYGYASFEDAFKKALILTTVRYPSGYSDVKYILTNYGSTIGITKTAYDSVYRNLIGDYTNSEALAKAYNDAVNPQGGGNSGNSGSGGSGTGGSSSGSKGSGSSTSLTFENTGNSGAKNEITAQFNDIDGVDWATEAIIALADKGILNGKSEGMFKPYDNITREEFAKILVCAMGLDKASYSGNNFTDVSENDWFCKFVNIAFEHNILNGTGDKMFGTGEQISRQDIAVMVCNALKSKGKDLPNAELAFEDKDIISDYAIDSVAALYKLGVVNGISETQFDPQGKATRAQAAKIIYGVLNDLK